MSSFGQLHARVGPGDRRVIPLGDLAEEDAGDRLRGELQIRRDPGNVVGQDRRAQHRGKVQNLEAGLLELIVGHRAVGGAEIHGLCSQLANAAARTDGLVVDLDVRMQLVILVKPFRINRIRETSRQPH